MLSKTKNFQDIPAKTPLPKQLIKLIIVLLEIKWFSLLGYAKSIIKKY